MKDQLAAESRRADDLSAKLMFASEPTEDRRCRRASATSRPSWRLFHNRSRLQKVETMERGSLAIDNELEICVLTQGERGFKSVAGEGAADPREGPEGAEAGARRRGRRRPGTRNSSACGRSWRRRREPPRRPPPRRQSRRPAPPHQ